MPRQARYRSWEEKAAPLTWIDLWTGFLGLGFALFCRAYVTSHPLRPSPRFALLQKARLQKTRLWICLFAASSDSTLPPRHWRRCQRMQQLKSPFSIHSWRCNSGERMWNGIFGQVQCFRTKEQSMLLGATRHWLLAPYHSFLFCPKHYPQKSLILMTHVEIPSQGQHSFSFDRLPGRGAAENRHRASNDVAAMTGGRTLWSRSRSQLPCPCLSASRNQKSRYLSSTHKASPLARCLFWWVCVVKISIHLNSSEEINPVILYGPKARGFGIECPRDKCMGTSYADALDAKHTGPANAGTSRGSTAWPAYRFWMFASLQCIWQHNIKQVALVCRSNCVYHTSSSHFNLCHVVLGGLWRQPQDRIPISESSPCSLHCSRSCSHGPGTIPCRLWWRRWHVGARILD